MSKELEILDRPFTTTNGKVVSFDKLGKRTQKTAILQLAIKAQSDKLQAYDDINDCKLTAKKMRTAFKNSELGKKLSETSRKASEARKLVDAKNRELLTIVEVAKALGVDVASDIQKLQLVEVNE